MVFKSYKREEIPEEYKEINFYSVDSLREKIRDLSGRTAIIGEMHNKKQCFEGRVLYDFLRNPDVLFLLDVDSPKSEGETLSFRLENIEEIFLKE